MTAGDRHGLVCARVGNEKQRSLEALLYFSYSAEVDQKSPVDAEESLVFELLFEAIEAAAGGQKLPLIARQPDFVVVGLGVANLTGIEKNPFIIAHGDDPARKQARVGGAE